MTHYDVFNGDADGLCALQQLRLAQPRRSVVVTGVKRDIALLQRVPGCCGDTVTVLDVSLHRNRAALGALLECGVAVEYFDHHFAGEVPVHPRLAAHLDAAPEVCTSVLVDRHLRGRHRAWAVVGAYGDSLRASAEALADTLSFTASQRGLLRALGEAINYNAYGETEADLLVPPAQLVQLLRGYDDPLAFATSEPLAGALMLRQADDLAQAAAHEDVQRLAGASVHVLPDQPWARRVHGAFANAVSQRSPERAHVVLAPARDGSLVASVRAPVARPLGADTLCLAFATGGGRTAAAGIDALPHAGLDDFLRALDAAFPAPVAAVAMAS